MEDFVQASTLLDGTRITAEWVKEALPNALKTNPVAPLATGSGPHILAVAAKPGNEEVLRTGQSSSVTVHFEVTTKDEVLPLALYVKKVVAKEFVHTKERESLRRDLESW